MRQKYELAAFVIREFQKSSVWNEAVLTMRPKQFDEWEQARIADIIETTLNGLRYNWHGKRLMPPTRGGADAHRN